MLNSFPKFNCILESFILTDLLSFPLMLHVKNRARNRSFVLVMSSHLLSDPSLLEELKDKKEKMTNSLQLSPQTDSIKKNDKKKDKHTRSHTSKSDIPALSGRDSLNNSPDKKKIKKKRKKKTFDDDDEEKENSDTSSEFGDSAINVPSKRQRLIEKGPGGSTDEDGELTAEGEIETESDPNAVSNFRISAPLREKLKSKGIESLFPIQAMSFDMLLNGSDLVGRARTGQGKTLAFVLPILEYLTNGRGKESRKTGYGRPPSVLVLLPTRELASQVFADFETYGGALGLSSACVYGGASFYSQEIALRRGTDIVVGTPGRIKDHIERGVIDLRSLKFRVLDEADEMLRMGFVEDVELILGKVEDVSKVQTLLFSATLPSWVKQIASRFLKPEKKTIDLVGNEKVKASTTVRHIALPCSHLARAQLIPDIIRSYSSGGRTIIFTETKDSCSELADLLRGSRALHGDIQQSQREVTLAGFRAGKFLVLVATNVAARGLDINDVQLIIQCEPPRDVESYIHRSGRTGRAGNSGVAVMLYEPKKAYIISKIERESGVKFEHVSAPQPAEIARSAGLEAAETISEVSDSVVPVFKSAAEQLLSSSGLSAVDLLAKALAKTAGYTDIKNRSLLTSLENYVTLLLDAGRPIYTPSFAFSVLRRFLPEEKVERLKGLSLTADGKSAVFDVPAEDVDLFIAGQENANMVSLEVLTELPPLQDKEQSRGGNGWRGGRFSGGSSTFDRRGGGGSRFRFSGGRGGSGNSNRRGGGGGSNRRGGGFSGGGKQGGGRDSRSDRRW